MTIPRHLVRFTALILTLALSACVAPETTKRSQMPQIALPPMKTFPVVAAPPPGRSNASIARDLIELEFRMETGRDLGVLTRFEGPITVTLTGDVPDIAPIELDQLLGRLRHEAGLDISRVGEGPASITVDFLPRAKLHGLVPQAACFVVPRVTGWDDYKAARRSDRVDWRTLTVRDRATIFVPSDTGPQELRDCLHEELAQALGPLNDLYRLTDSVFNDDNFRNVLTGFDMLALKVHYAPEMHNGMTEADYAAALPRVLQRLNPGGGKGRPLPPDPTPMEWKDAIETALGPTGTLTSRRRAAARAVELARNEGWQDSRLAFSYFAFGRLSLADEIELAVMALLEARYDYAQLPGTDIQVAHIDMQMAALALSLGQADDVLALTSRAIPAARKAQNAALLSTLLMLRAEGMELKGRKSEARALRLDSLSWARYGFGTDEEAVLRMGEIAALAPVTQVGADDARP
ncbi:DUF2927 domain-containing protein [Tabrizicola sp. J26]|uniref:DUF2927 domain-containing protein n=1 Tax=Alitabrizicola rongguiensis TaxID=2909234 RepID=UPI001F269BFB|nr:DUF2927 domain-containing protein [Tabrizicola rongguiensis]MCF1710075.1 DUF2927 domain-containing protein [Tabrizicola rongguiensis]